jgi:hypothetical protein
VPLKVAMPMDETSNATDEWTTLTGRVCSEAAAVRMRHCTVGAAGPLQGQSGGVAWKDAVELGAGADAELEEHLAQVVLDSTRADE